MPRSDTPGLPGRRNRPSTGYGEIQVTGLVELQRALKNLEPEVQKHLKSRLKKVGELVKRRVQSKMPVRSGKARSSVRVGVTNTGAYVAHGKASAPYTPWLDFGGQLKPIGGRKNTQNRPVLREGRYLYPAIEETAPQTRAAALKAFEETAREVGLK